MENLEYTKEAIGNIRNEMTHTWGTTFLFGGGTVSLAFQADSLLKWVFIAIGMLCTLIFLNAYFVRWYRLNKYTNELKRRLK